MPAASPRIIGRLKLEENGHPGDAITTVAAAPRDDRGRAVQGAVRAGHPFDPRKRALVIDTPAGRILHSGDFKLDDNPAGGRGLERRHLPRDRGGAADPGADLQFDQRLLAACRAGPKATLRDPIRDLIARRSGMVVATTFASNVARLKTLAEAAQAAGRSICLLGRAMKRMVAAARGGRRADRLPAHAHPGRGAGCAAPAT